MRAARFHAAGEPLRVEDAPLPPLAADEVRVRVRAAGLCGTELHFLDGLYAPAKTPMTLGHEVAGEVAEMGASVTGRRAGDRVAVNYYLFCGRCRWCLRGQQQLCTNPRGVFAFLSDGGFAEYVTVPEHCLVSLPHQLTFEAAATLCCSATTALHACEVAQLASDETVVIYGLGGVGLSLVEVAARRAARVVAVGRTVGKLTAARRLGAHLVLQPEEAAVAVSELGGADVVVETVGSAGTMPQAVGMLGRRGRLVFVGYSEATLEVSPLQLLVAEQQIRTSVGNTHAELETAVDLASRDLLHPLVDDVVELDGINAAIDRLRRGDVVGRVVIRP